MGEREDKTVLLGLSPDELAELAVEAGARSFAGNQIAAWIYGRGATGFGEMTDLATAVRAKLGETCEVAPGRIVSCEESGEETTKLAIALNDGTVIESVLMTERGREGDRFTACLSTQAGCAMGCRFCASGLSGLKRNLTAGEILGQLTQLGTTLAKGTRITNVVFMGMGEPLHNLAALRTAITALNAPWGFGLGARRITVSTVGLPKAMRELANFGVQVNLAVSLHAVDDDSRSSLIPTNAGISEILNAAEHYFDKTGREVTIEYTLVGGENDSREHAAKLATLLHDYPKVNVNLIAMNPVGGTGLNAPTTAAVEEFRETLSNSGVNTHVRRRRGRTVQAACGQLRLRVQEEVL